jgi:hypothetical protein
VWNTHTNEVRRFGSAPIIRCNTSRISIGGYHQLTIFTFHGSWWRWWRTPLNLNLGGTIDLGDVGRSIGDGSQPLFF